MRNKLKNPFFLFVLGLGITLFIFSIYPAVRITNAQSDEGEKCVGNYDDGSCIQTLVKDCQAKFKYSERPKHLVTPTCDQTPDELRTITYKTGKQPFDEYCYPVRSCGLNDFVQLFVDLAIWGWWILPSLALLMFIWGGFLLLSSGGKQEQIQTAKRMLTSVLIGSVIVLLLAWVITGLVISMLTGEKGGLIFGKPWFGTGGEVSANTGCCITKYLCYENKTENWCLDQPDEERWRRGEPCLKEGQKNYTTCKNKSANVCCVPKDQNNHNCELPSGSSGCADFPDTELTSKACALIIQCLPPPSGPPGTKNCCIHKTNPGDCTEVDPLTPCPAPIDDYNPKPGSCSSYSECLGCCYVANPGGRNPYQCEVTTQAKCNWTAWAFKQQCTPTYCGQTCCSYTCGVGKPNVKVSDCNAAGGEPTDDPAGQCNPLQLQTGCCRQTPASFCWQNMNIWYCMQRGYQNYCENSDCSGDVFNPDPPCAAPIQYCPS